MLLASNEKDFRNTSAGDINGHTGHNDIFPSPWVFCAIIITQKPSMALTRNMQSYYFLL